MQCVTEIRDNLTVCYHHFHYCHDDDVVIVVVVVVAAAAAAGGVTKDSNNSPLFANAAINSRKTRPKEDQLTRIVLSPTPSDFKGRCQNLTVKSVVE